MKQLIAVFLFIVSPFAGQAQEENKITIGTIERISSKILNEDREIRVYIPNGEQATVGATERYPVLYVLDGEAHFNSVVGMMEQLSSYGNTIVPQMIIVAISNTNRMRDLSPTRVEADPPMLSKEQAENTGGNATLFAFMEKELFPYIESKYAVQSYRMFIGHSLGGLTVINAMVNYTHLFNAYVAIDPSMWWDDGRFLNECKIKLTNAKFKNVSLYMGIANTLENGMDITTVQNDTTRDSKHIRSILDLDKHIKNTKQNQLNYKSKYYEDDTHNSAPLITEYDAIRFFFGFYKLAVTMQDYTSTTTAFPIKIENHFNSVSDKMGYKVAPPEGFINDFGYSALETKKMPQAEYFFKLNVKNYPQSSNVYDSLGDYYVAIGDKANAIISFKKALSIKEVPETAQKLKLLETK
jgi:predicted alpha/beta superfamily hydrolase